MKKETLYFKEALEMWMNNNRIRLKQSTITKYQNLINAHILPELGLIKLSQIDATLINTFLASKLQNGRLSGNGGLSPAYVRSIMLIINATVQFAVREEFMEPLKSQIHKPAISKKELEILSIAEQKKMEDYVSKDLNGTKMAILLSLHTGLRIGEICALAWEDIDLENQIIHVRHTVVRINNQNSTENPITKLILDSPKTKSSLRDVPISSHLHPYLMTYFSYSNSKYVISNSEIFMNPRTLEYRYHRILNECGIKSVNFHVLRHTFASRCVAAGVDIKTLSEILGHGNVSITLNTYVHTSMEQKRTQLEKLTSYFSQN